MLDEGTNKARLTFGDLKVGDHFIFFPAPGDNHGHGGYLGGHNLFKKTEQRASGPSAPVESGAAVDGRSVVSHFPDLMPVIKVLDVTKDEAYLKEQSMNYRTRQLSTREMLHMSLITDILHRSARAFSKGGPLHSGDFNRKSAWSELSYVAARSSNRYLSAVLGDVTVNVGSLAGRVMITFLRGEKSVTLIGAEDDVDRGCGMHAIAASAGEAQEMIEAVIRNWDITLFKAAKDLSIV